MKFKITYTALLHARNEQIAKEILEDMDYPYLHDGLKIEYITETEFKDGSPISMYEQYLENSHDM